MTRIRMPLSYQLEDKFLVGDGCWEWTAYRSPQGYGSIRRGGRNVPAHRAVHELLIGAVPEGLVLDHLCRNPGCVRPDHLEPVTDRENLLRGMGVPARNARRTHCLNGHEFSPENTYVFPSGRKRCCRACQKVRWRDAARRMRARKKAEA